MSCPELTTLPYRVEDIVPGLSPDGMPGKVVRGVDFHAPGIPLRLAATRRTVTQRLSAGRGEIEGSAPGLRPPGVGVSTGAVSPA